MRLSTFIPSSCPHTSKRKEKSIRYRSSSATSPTRRGLRRSAEGSYHPQSSALRASCEIMDVFNDHVRKQKRLQPWFCHFHLKHTRKCVTHWIEKILSYTYIYIYIYGIVIVSTNIWNEHFLVWRKSQPFYDIPTKPFYSTHSLHRHAGVPEASRRVRHGELPRSRCNAQGGPASANMCRPLLLI